MCQRAASGPLEAHRPAAAPCCAREMHCILPSSLLNLLVLGVHASRETTYGFASLAPLPQVSHSSLRCLSALRGHHKLCIGGPRPLRLGGRCSALGTPLAAAWKLGIALAAFPQTSVHGSGRTEEGRPARKNWEQPYSTGRRQLPPAPRLPPCSCQHDAACRWDNLCGSGDWRLGGHASRQRVGSPGAALCMAGRRLEVAREKTAPLLPLV